MTTQQDFRTALLDPQAAVPADLSDGQARPAGRRFNVYRNNVAVSLTEALTEGFPVVAKLLGDENMTGLAGVFLRAHPPASPLMMQYGDALPDFLAGLPQLDHLGYLPDVARLELALRRSYHAADATPVDPDVLGALDPAALLSARMTFAPALQVLRSPWPIHAIWRFNMQPDAPKPQPGGQDVLITRPEFDPYPHVLPPGGAAFINALSAGATLADAHGAALADAPEFDPGPCLTLLLQGQAITSVTAKDPT